MAPRAIWKGVIRFGEVRVPVKLYTALEDRTLHFRMLHAEDRAPVRQELVNPETGEVTRYGDAQRAFLSPQGDLVLLHDDELAALEPEPSRDIQILRFLPPGAIDYRWHVRPYYLGPDEGGEDVYPALTAALARRHLEGLAKWVMRGKTYLGALRLHQGYPLLVALRHAGEVVSLEDIEIPPAPALAASELAMARELMALLAGDFDPSAYRDAYRARVHELIETKRREGEAREAPPPQRRRAEDLSRALADSLEQERARHG